MSRSIANVKVKVCQVALTWDGDVKVHATGEGGGGAGCGVYEDMIPVTSIWGLGFRVRQPKSYI